MSYFRRSDVVGEQAENRPSDPGEDRLAHPGEDRFAYPAENPSRPSEDRFGHPAEGRIAYPAEDRMARPAEDRMARPAEDRMARPAEEPFAGSAENRLAGSGEDWVAGSEEDRFAASDESHSTDDEEGRGGGSRWGGLGDRLARVFVTQERRDGDEAELEPGQYADDELLADDTAPTARFPVGPIGYNRSAVDQYLADVERELDELRNRRPESMSINEEIERLGEQTASILVVAHDQASETTRRAQEQATETTRRAQEHATETTRRAQEQADRCIADAASNAVAITAKAKQQLRELDSETDAVWQERQRLIDDVRTTATALMSLAEEAAERFPAEDKPSVEFPATFTAEETPTVDFPAPFQE